MLKKIALAISPVVALIWTACSSNDVAGGTIDPNSIAEISSSSIENTDVVLSSSSIENIDVVLTSSSQNAGTLSSSSAREDNNISFVSSSSIHNSDPNLLPESSSSVNDSNNLEESSSSSEIEDRSRQLVTDVNIRCVLLAEDSLQEPSGDDVDYPLPEAYRYVGTERTGFTIKWLELTAGVAAKNFEVGVSGDTVYVKATFDYTNAQRHRCLSQIDFAVDNDSAYTYATLLNFQNDIDSRSSGVMRIFDMDVITIEEATGYKQAKDINLMCKNDRQYE